MNYVIVIFGIGDAAPHHSLQDLFRGVRCSGVEFHYVVSLLLLLLTSLLIMVISSITDMVMSIATIFELQM